jgi:hypothetical protein
MYKTAFDGLAMREVGSVECCEQKRVHIVLLLLDPPIKGNGGSVMRMEVCLNGEHVNTC